MSDTGYSEWQPLISTSNPNTWIDYGEDVRWVPSPKYVRMSEEERVVFEFYERYPMMKMYDGAGPSTLDQWTYDIARYYVSALGAVIAFPRNYMDFQDRMKIFSPVVSEVARKLLFPRHIYFENP